jgi:hypothetical protein
VIDPLGRYHYAKKLKAGGKPYPEIADLVLPLHDKFWKTEEAMAEGSPLLILERGEKVEMPPAQYVQGTDDVAHPRDHLDRFVAIYRKAAAIWSSNCSTAWPRVLSSVSRPHRNQPGQSKRSSRSCTNNCGSTIALSLRKNRAASEQECGTAPKCLY